MNEHAFPVRNFSHPSSDKACSTCLSHSNPANGWPHKFRSRSTTRSAVLSHDFGHLCRGRRIHTFWKFDFSMATPVSWPRVLHCLDVLGPCLVDEDSCCLWTRFKRSQNQARARQEDLVTKVVSLPMQRDTQKNTTSESAHRSNWRKTSSKKRLPHFAISKSHTWWTRSSLCFFQKRRPPNPAYGLRSDRVELVQRFRQVFWLDITATTIKPRTHRHDNLRRRPHLAKATKPGWRKRKTQNSARRCDDQFTTQAQPTTRTHDTRPDTHHDNPNNTQSSTSRQPTQHTSRHGKYHTTVTKSRYIVANSPQTWMIPMTQGWCAFNAFAWNATGQHVVQLIPHLHAHNSTRCQYKSHIRKRKFRQSIGHSCNASIQPTHTH